MITLRRLSRDPASYGAAAVLAFGFGAAAAVFALVNALLLKPLPFPESDRLVALRVAGPSWSPRLFEAVAREAGRRWSAAVLEEEAALAAYRKAHHACLEHAREQIARREADAADAARAKEVHAVWAKP